jgi:hypothetical protein
MDTHMNHQDASRRAHLQLVGSPRASALPAPAPAPAGPTDKERRTMARVAGQLRRRAAKLPEDSVLRAELLETAEYFATGAEEGWASSTISTRQAAARAS